jgi:glycerol-3-phosphate cytidylyltransferase/FAD synthetase
MILATMFVSSLKINEDDNRDNMDLIFDLPNHVKVNNQDIVENIQKKTHLDTSYINNHIENLVSDNLMHGDKKTLTELGRNSLRVVLTGGVFDIIHPGHIHTLSSAKKLGDVLVVVIATDLTVQKMKKRTPLHTQEQRKQLIESLRMVDLCLIGHEDDIFKTVNMVKPQIIALGYDQVHQEKFILDGCKKINLDIKVARLQSSVPQISSTDIEKKYGDEIHET